MSVDDILPVILAGGRGTRLGRILPDLPKPMAPAAGRPFVEWIVRNLAAGGFGRVFLSTGYLAHIVEDFFAERPVPGVEVRCVREDRALGTGGAFLHVAAQSGLEPHAWLVLNGDSLVFVDWAGLISRLDRPEVDGVIVTCQVEDTSRFGRLLADGSRRLQAFEEKRAGCCDPGLVNAGVYLLRNRILAGCPSQRPLGFEQDLFPVWLRDGRHLEIYPAETEFIDIGTEETLSQADVFIRRHKDRFR